MADEKKPYIERKPGDFWTAEIWNSTQVKIREEIEAKVNALNDEIDKNGVNLAKNADKFAGKTSNQWIDDLDQKYALKAHNHEGGYRSYFRRFTPEKPSAIIRHRIGEFPLSEAYGLDIIARLDQGRIALFYLYSIEEGQKEERKIWLKDQRILLTDDDNNPIYRGVPAIDILRQFKNGVFDVLFWKNYAINGISLKAFHDLLKEYLGNSYDLSGFVLAEIGNGAKINPANEDKYLLAFYPIKMQYGSEYYLPFIVAHLDYDTLLVNVSKQDIEKTKDRAIWLMILLRA